MTEQMSPLVSLAPQEHRTAQNRQTEKLIEPGFVVFLNRF